MKSKIRGDLWKSYAVFCQGPAAMLRVHFLNSELKLNDGDVSVVKHSVLIL